MPPARKTDRPDTTTPAIQKALALLWLADSDPESVVLPEEREAAVATLREVLKLHRLSAPLPDPERDAWIAARAVVLEAELRQAAAPTSLAPYSEQALGQAKGEWMSQVAVIRRTG